MKLMLLSCLVASIGQCALASNQLTDSVFTSLRLQTAKLSIGSEKADKERCSATILSANVLITAAHCVFGKKPREITAIFSQNQTDEWEVGSKKFVSQILLPPTLNSDSILTPDEKSLDISDYALLILAEPIGLPFRAAHTPTMEQNSGLIFLTGYGTTMLNSPARFHFHAYSARAFEADGDGTERWLMTTFCDGDSGGGVCQIVGQDVFLVGANSRGSACFGGGLARVTWMPSKVSAWINQQLAAGTGKQIPVY